MKEDIRKRWKRSAMVLDGAMGTMLYAKGVFVNACFDELNVSRPDLVRSIHDEYIAAGAEAIETNTFGANPIRLRGYGQAEKTVEINLAGVRLAREAAGEDAWVLGSVGPCLRTGQVWRDEARDEVHDAFSRQLQALAEGGVDAVVLETFSHPEELLLAAGIAADLEMPVLASVTVGADGCSALGLPAANLVRIMEECPDIDVVGLNCGIGPAPLFDIVTEVLPLAQKPFLVMPNAGMPREVDGRLIYMTSPEYFTRYARRFVQQGIRVIGGCCGTTPEHIRVAAKAIRSLSGVKRHLEIRAATPEMNPDVTPVPPEQKSRFARRLLAGHKVSSVELTPPRSCDLSTFLEAGRICHERGIDAVNIPDGPRASSRISPTIAAIELLRRVGIEPILHYCCRDRNLIGMQSDLLGGYAAGIRNFLIVTGDPPKLGDYPDATGVFDVDSIGLVQVAANLNRGVDIGGSPIAPATGLFIGVGANPVAVSIDTEIERLVRKVQAGAEFIITQPVFDPDQLLRFMDRARNEGADLPVVAGIWPLVSYRNAEFMRNEVPGVVIPDAVMERMAACRSKDEAISTGIEIAREIRFRIEDRVAGYQVSAPFGKVDIASEVLA